MWVWDGNKENREKRKVLYVLSNKEIEKYKNLYTECYVYTVITLNADSCVTTYQHCTEIETEIRTKTQRYMTNQELAWWLRDGVHREVRNTETDYVFSFYNYEEKYKDKRPIDIFNIEIRENGGE